MKEHHHFVNTSDFHLWSNDTRNQLIRPTTPLLPPSEHRTNMDFTHTPSSTDLPSGDLYAARQLFDIESSFAGLRLVGICCPTVD